MAVQKKRVTRSKRDMRRAHDAITGATLSTDSLSGEKHLRHHISPEGYYKGRQVIEPKEDLEADSEE